jgi:hypothetical protein
MIRGTERDTDDEWSAGGRRGREGKLNDESGENWRICGNGWVGRW